jgi:hypothetical protein
MPRDAKPFKGVGSGVFEIALRLSVANIIDVKFADSDQLIRGFGGNHDQFA